MGETVHKAPFATSSLPLECVRQPFVSRFQHLPCSVMALVNLDAIEFFTPPLQVKASSHKRRITPHQTYNTFVNTRDWPTSSDTQHSDALDVVELMDTTVSEKEGSICLASVTEGGKHGSEGMSRFKKPLQYSLTKISR